MFAGGGQGGPGFEIAAGVAFPGNPGRFEVAVADVAGHEEAVETVKDWLGIDGHAGLNVPVVGVAVAGFMAELVRRQAVQDIGQAVQEGVVHLNSSFEVWMGTLASEIDVSNP